MVSIAEAEINLFGKELPSVEQIRKLSRIVNSSQINRAQFAKKIESSEAEALAAGIGFFIIGRDAEAIEKLKRAKDCKEKFLYLAYILRRMGSFEEALSNLEKAAANQADSLTISLEKSAVLRVAGRFDEADKLLRSCTNFEQVNAEYHYQLARLQENQGTYEQAIENYETAIELDPDHTRAVFHLAFVSDLCGDEEAAIDYYKQIASTSPVIVSALLNLAVLYEDMEEYDKAERCIDKVLQSHPSHPRAILFKKDIESSKTMEYDEEKEKKKGLQHKIFETPITDFELSVRSRNCLRRMNIITIGDLLRTTEVELLAYKNFGETSLTEIKAILDPKGLYLGMALEEAASGEDENLRELTGASEDILNKPVEQLQVSVRAQKCLEALGLSTLSELVKKTEAELLGCKNFGVTSLNEIKQQLNAQGLSLRELD